MLKWQVYSATNLGKLLCVVFLRERKYMTFFRQGFTRLGTYRAWPALVPSGDHFSLFILARIFSENLSNPRAVWHESRQQIAEFERPNFVAGKFQFEIHTNAGAWTERKVRERRTETKVFPLNHNLSACENFGFSYWFICLLHVNHFNTYVSKTELYNLQPSAYRT